MGEVNWVCVCVSPQYDCSNLFGYTCRGVLLQQAGAPGGSPMDIVNAPTPGTTDHRKNALLQFKTMFLPILVARGNGN